MTEDAAHLREILNNPADDAVRLQFADWLEEQASRHQVVTDSCSTCGGDGLATGTPECRPCRRCQGTGRLTQSDGLAERAEFIRVQIEIPKLRKQKGWLPTEEEMARMEPGQLEILFRANNHDRESRLDDLRRRERELLGDWETGTIQGLHPDRSSVLPCRRCDWHQPIEHGGYEWKFRRGFVAEISCTCADFMRHAEAIFRSHPVQKVTLSDCEPIGPIAGGPNAGQWFWTRRDWPDDFWPYFFDGRITEHMVTTRSVPSSAAALAALSAACVAHGRNAAGLSPLPASRQATS